MTYSDFYRAVTPFNHSHIMSNYSYLKKFKKNADTIMNYADADNNGVISFTEFFFFMTVIQLQDKNVQHLFEDGKLTSKEFSKQLTALRRRTKFGANQKDGGNLLDSRHVKAKDQDFLATNAAMTEKIFAGRENINIDDFYKLKHEILENLWHYEYY